MGKNVVLKEKVNGENLRCFKYRRNWAKKGRMRREKERGRIIFESRITPKYLNICDCTNTRPLTITKTVRNSKHIPAPTPTKIPTIPTAGPQKSPKKCSKYASSDDNKVTHSLNVYITRHLKCNFLRRHLGRGRGEVYGVRNSAERLLSPSLPTFPPHERNTQH